MSGMHQNSYILDKILESKKLDPKFFIIEAIGFSSWIPENDEFGFKRRFVQWHDLDNTIEVLQTIHAEASDEGLPERLQIYWDRIPNHLQFFYMRNSFYGKGFDLFELAIERMSEQQVKPIQFSLVKSEDPRISLGYEPLPHETHASFESFLNNPEDWQKQLDETVDYETAKVPRTPRNLPAFIEQIHQVRDRGARLLYIGVPSVTIAHRDSAPFWWMEERGLISFNYMGDGTPLFLNFNHPGEFPHLHRLEARFDEHHLNNQSVRLFSEDLAHLFIEKIYPERDIPCETGAHDREMRPAQSE